MRWSLLLALLLGPASAAAYDSRCYLGDDACAEGEQAARGRWVGPSDEHRQLFALSLGYAGLPPGTNADFQLDVYVEDRTIMVEGTPSLTFTPAPFRDAQRRVSRTHSVDEFSQLPDFGYALFDWATGFETCPIDNTDAKTCHTFAGHMGTVNANHFLPQAQGFFRYYHQLALTRAGECRAMGEALGSEAARFTTYLHACEKEALLLEAIAHHYLQDAWSSGHMWARWGSPELEDFPSEHRGIIIAATAGLVHGARALLQSSVLPGQLLDADDAMCAPHEEVEWVQGREQQQGVGDLYMEAMLTEPAYQAQRAALFSCAVSSIRQVYEAAGAQHGPLADVTGPGTQTVEPDSELCFGQRATNLALQRGLGIDLTLATGAPVHIPIKPSIASRVVAISDAQANDTTPSGARYAFDLIRVSAQLNYFAKVDPSGTSLASGAIAPLLGVAANDRFVADPPASYVDPALPWRPSETDPGRALARTFHRAHAVEWCAAFAPGDTEHDLSTLRSRLATASPPVRDDLCGLCTEMAQRHVRVGTDAASYDATREPLCAFLRPESQIIYAPGAAAEGIEVIAARWCGC